MKTKHFSLLLLLFITQFAAAQQWTWMNGEQAVGVNGQYGNRLIEAPSNIPGSRTGACSWKDANGNIWIFGGRGNGESSAGLLNDLWKFNPATNQWTWMSGDKNPDIAGSYGILGLPLLITYPGSRQNAVGWTDNQGNLWLFGGSGIDAGSNTGLLNDLWRYSISGGFWTWVGGSNEVNQQGDYGERADESGSNFPGARTMATTWKDRQGNFWLFGGRGYAEDDDDVSDLNDLWRFSPERNRWTWMHGDDSEDGDAHYGDKGEFDDRNTPGGRRGSTGWVDRQGNFWLFGGSSRSDLFSDLWKYNVGQNEWAWISGSKDLNEEPNNGHPGSRMLSIGWTDAAGDLWLFGGSGYNRNAGTLNSVWKYAVAANTWTFIKGPQGKNAEPVFGTKGIADANNRPGGTENAVEWEDQQGNFWLFGGQSGDGSLNQLWKLSREGGCDEISGAVVPATASICGNGVQLLTADGGTSYEWRRNGEVIAGQVNETIKVTEPGRYSVIIIQGNCRVPAANDAVVTRSLTPVGSISPSKATICEGESQVLTATGGTSYQWMRNGTAIPGETRSTISVKQAGNYSVIIKNGSCTGPASNTSVVTVAALPSGNITPATATICEGGSQVLTASGGTSYQWKLNGETIEGQTSASITIAKAGTYSVIIKNENCSAEATNTAEVIYKPGEGIRYSDISTTEDRPVQLAARPIGVSYQWTPPTGIDNPGSPSPVLTTTTGGQYLVRITNEEGCIVTDTQLVKITKTTEVFVPTAFTPNGNNTNDRLRPLGNVGAVESFRIYNRWGNLVYQTDNINEGWDGRFKGVLQSADTYTWVISGKTPDGEPFTQSGKTLLIR